MILLSFMKNLTDFLNALPSTGHTYICGDFNINLLKIHTISPIIMHFLRQCWHTIFIQKLYYQLAYATQVAHLSTKYTPIP